MINNKLKFSNKRISISIRIIIIVFVVFLVGGILAWQYWGPLKEKIKLLKIKTLKEVSFPEERITISHTYFKIKPLEVIPEPILFEGPGTDRYGCTADYNCAYIIDNGDCDLLPENDCGNVSKYGFKVQKGLIQKPAAETIKRPSEEGIIINDCDVSKIVIDTYTNCECATHMVLTEPCSIDSETGEKICMWVEDRSDYSYCTKSKKQSKPDIAITNLQLNNISVGVDTKDAGWTVTLKNIENNSLYCSEVLTDIDFGDGMAVSIKNTWCTHYYPLEYCKEHYLKNYAFLPGQELTLRISYKYQLPGHYTIRAYTQCIDPQEDSNWTNNKQEGNVSVAL